MLERAGDTRHAPDHQHPVVAVHDQFEPARDRHPALPRCRRGPGRGEQDRQHHGEPRRCLTSAGQPPQARSRGGDGHERRVEGTEREAGAPGRHRRQPPGEHRGGHVESGRDPVEPVGGTETGDEPRPEAPHHQRAGGGHGEEVGRDGGQRHRAEGGEEQRRGPGLGGERDGQQLPDGRGAGQHGTEAGTEQQDARRRRGRQAEPHGAGQQRVDQDQPGDREPEHPDARRRAAERRRRGGHRGHRRGPHDGRLEADQQAEEPHRAQASPAAAPTTASG